MKSIVRGLSLLLLVLLAACSSGGSSQPETVVLVYLLGTDLESRDGSGTTNLREMMAVDSTSHVTVVVQTGGAKKTGAPPDYLHAMQPESIDWTHLQRYVVHPGRLEQVADLGADSETDPLHNMGSGMALWDFLDWGVRTYPARRYVVVLWDHGGGVNLGIGSDEITKWSISVPEIAAVLGSVASSRNSVIELAGFDACLMATAEVAAALSPSARYMVASEDIEPGTGWDYTAFLQFLDRNPTATGAQIGAEIASSYQAKQARAQNHDITLSVVDLSRVGPIVASMNSFAQALRTYTTTQSRWKAIAKGRALSLDWKSVPMEGESFDLVDLSSLASNVVDRIAADVGPDPTLSSAGVALRSAVSSAVTTNVRSGANANATGLTVYFPAVMSAYPDWKYASNTEAGDVPYFASQYTDGATGFLEAYHGFYDANTAALLATVTMTQAVADPLSALVNSDYDQALAAHQVDGCQLFEPQDSGPDRQVSIPCFDTVRLPDEEAPPASGGAWWLNVGYATGWPTLSVGSGSGLPVPLVPDQYGGKNLGTVNTYVIPAWLRDEDDSTVYSQGGLTVEEVFPVTPGPSTLRVTGWRRSARIPGKEYALQKGQVYAMGAFATVNGARKYYRSSRQVTVPESGTLSLSTQPVPAGKLGYFVVDLTGAVQESDLVDYTPPR